MSEVCHDYDSETGKQVKAATIRCTCGKRLPLNSRYSICDTCMNFDEFLCVHAESYQDGY